MASSILRYFKPKSGSNSSSLPEPNGSLTKVVPSEAIKLANIEVAKLKQPHGRGPYLFLTPAQGYEETRARHARVSSVVLINAQQIMEIYVVSIKLHR